MLNRITRAAVIASAMMLPLVIQAQRGGGMGRMGGADPAGARGGGMGRMGDGGGMGRMGVGGGMGGNPVAPLINMRRELNLSSRQLTQLDSIERTLLQRNQSIRERVRTRLDSLRPRTRESSEAEIQRYRAETDSLRGLRQQVVRNDSLARIAAMNVLTDSQRVRVRERMAERRGFAAGRMSAMRGGRAGMGGVRGGRGIQGFGPRMRGPGGRGRIGGMVDPGLRPRGGMRGPDGSGQPRMMPDDSMSMRRFRRPPGEAGPENQDLAPRRGQLDDSTRSDRGPRRPPSDSGR